MANARRTERPGQHRRWLETEEGGRKDEGSKGDEEREDQDQHESQPVLRPPIVPATYSTDGLLVWREQTGS